MIKVIMIEGGMIMSFGLVEASTIKSKKALKEAVAARGAENISVFDTSMFNSLGTITLAHLFELQGSRAVIVGPDVNRDRRWYANVARKADGTYYIK